MRRSGVINTHLAGALASLRHTDVFAISDSGFSSPPDAWVIDLSIVYGTPTVTPVLRAILRDVVVEQAWVAAEQAERSPARRAEILDEIADVPVDPVPHEELRAMARDARFFIQTGDDRPYSNIVLRAGVGFPV